MYFPLYIFFCILTITSVSSVHGLSSARVEITKNSTELEKSKILFLTAGRVDSQVKKVANKRNKF